MAGIFNGLFGGAKPSESPIPAGDSDFADFAEVPDPSPASFSSVPTVAVSDTSALPTLDSVVYTKWYNVHERHSLSEFKAEGIILIIILVMVVIHLVGARANRSKAKAWISAHAPVLEKEFALVGFGGRKTIAVDVEGEGRTNDSSLEDPSTLMKEKSLTEYATYATGRQNVAFLHANITLHKRFNPFNMIAEYVLSFLFDSNPFPTEKMEAILYPFDGREGQSVPGQAPGAQELRSRDSKSGYDGFVWAVVNKDSMKTLRDERYDVSITTTKDSSKLPIWATVMSESAEVTDMLLTPDFIKAIEEIGDMMDYIIITDQPIEKPKTIDEATPKKRLYYSIRLPSSATGYAKALPLFEYFLRLPDLLVQSAHFRPEVMRKVKSMREEMIRRLQKAEEEEKAEERALEREKAKKMKRDMELKGLDAKAQKKYLEKEKEKEIRKMQKRQTTRA